MMLSIDESPNRRIRSHTFCFHKPKQYVDMPNFIIPPIVLRLRKVTRALVAKLETLCQKNFAM